MPATKIELAKYCLTVTIKKIVWSIIKFLTCLDSMAYCLCKYGFREFSAVALFKTRNLDVFDTVFRLCSRDVESDLMGHKMKMA